jgi:hypothetical protein
MLPNFLGLVFLATAGALRSGERFVLAQGLQTSSLPESRWSDLLVCKRPRDPVKGLPWKWMNDHNTERVLRWGLFGEVLVKRNQKEQLSRSVDGIAVHL